MASGSAVLNVFPGTAGLVVDARNMPATERQRPSFRQFQDYAAEKAIGDARDQGTSATMSRISPSVRAQTGPRNVSSERVLGLKRWEGQIVEVSEGWLTVELIPADHDGPELVADFQASLLGSDSHTAGPGDTVYLTTRTIRNAVGYPYQTSSLKLRRLGVWSAQDLDEISEIARRQAEFFKEM